MSTTLDTLRLRVLPRLESFVFDLFLFDDFELFRWTDLPRDGRCAEESEESEEAGLLPPYVCLWCTLGEFSRVKDEARARGGRRLSLVGGPMAGAFNGGGDMGAHEESLLIGCFIQVVTEVASPFRLGADLPPFECVSIATQAFCSASKATHSECPAVL